MTTGEMLKLAVACVFILGYVVPQGKRGNVLAASEVWAETGEEKSFDSNASNDAEIEVFSEISAEDQYQTAIGIRDNIDATQDELKEAVQLLYKAAGIEHISIEKKRKSDKIEEPASLGFADDATGDSSKEDKASTKIENNVHESANIHQFITAKDVTIRFQNDTIGHFGAVRELIYIFSMENEGAPFNPAVAHALLYSLADAGDPEAQSEMGLYLALGMELVAPNPENFAFILTEPDLPSALTLHYFAARNDDPVSQIVLGYRHLYGLGVPRSCKTAALYYSAAANKVLEAAQQVDGLPEVSTMRLSNSMSHHRPRPTPEQEFLHYQWFADYGHADAARLVAQLLHKQHGNPQEAIRYLRQAADAGDPEAMVHLGHAYANGLAVQQNNTTAWDWFWKSAESGHPGGFYGLGYMHLTGQGAQVDYRQAMKYLTYAIEKGQGWSGLGDALFYLGIMHLRGLNTEIDKGQAKSLFLAASKSGNLLAAYNLAVIQLEQGSTSENFENLCKSAVGNLKKVAERAWPALSEADEDFVNGEYSWALLGYLKGAEMGSELAQSNAAFMLQQGIGYVGNYAGERTVSLLRRAADQGNSFALVRLGDCFWYGRGIESDRTKAGNMYAEAAQRKVPQAMFNMGFLHQFGIGVAKDHHLAKRFYDSVVDSVPDGRIAGTLALYFLRVHGMYDHIRPNLPPWSSQLLDSIISILFIKPEESFRKLNSKTNRQSIGNRRQWGLSSILDILDVIDESIDSTLLIWLIAVLGLVLVRRQMIRSQRRRDINNRQININIPRDERENIVSGPASPPNAVQEMSSSNQTNERNEDRTE